MSVIMTSYSFYRLCQASDQWWSVRVLSGRSHVVLPLTFRSVSFFFFFFIFYFICYSKVQQLQQLQLLSQSIHAQTDYTPKHTCNSTITTQGMPTVILQVLFQKEETRKKLIIFVKEGKLTRLQSPFVH